MSVRFFLFLILTSLHFGIHAQTQSYQMNASQWEINTQTMSFEQFEGQDILLIKGEGEAFLKDVNFATGIIEFDFYPTEPNFSGLYFRRDASKTKDANFYSEFMYLRAFKMDDPIAFGGIQYAPITRGTNLWDILHQYEANALIKSAQWNKVKMVISQKQMKCYLNDKLVLWIPELLGKNSSGGISVEGPGRYTNMKITPNAIEDLPQTPGADIDKHDPRYLNHWQYSEEITLPMTQSMATATPPDSTTTWKSISATRFGLINLTEAISSPFMDKTRRMVWLRTTVESSMDQMKGLDIGFSDDIYLFVNGNLVYVDRNVYGQAIAKTPNGRLHLDNAEVRLPLQSGQNEILIGIANNFFGWGLVTRLEDMKGISGKLMPE
ncbi:MAG: family 16 glycoside hydrolase [Bacteroidota bacterium]